MGNSVNVSSGAFHCWGCDDRGVDFLRLRDGLSFKEACQQLSCWSGVSEAERLKLDSEAARRKGERDQAAQLKESGRQRLELHGEIHTLIRIHADTPARLDELLQGAAPAYENEVEDCWGALSLAFEDLRNC